MNSDHKKYIYLNKQLWNAWSTNHTNSDFYDVEGFKKGAHSLTDIEISELGEEVNGRTMLHLQCHFGLDTLSWERLGDIPTGVDFSENSIHTAWKLNMHSQFILSDIYDLKSRLEKRFDVVFTSYGMLFWLPDLKSWAEIIYHFLKPGATFYMVEFHPFLDILVDELKETPNGYFGSNEPVRYHLTGTYAAPDADITADEYRWKHPVGNIISSLTRAGLQIRFFHEFNYCAYPVYPGMIRISNGKYVIRDFTDKIPYMFSIMAVKL